VAFDLIMDVAFSETMGFCKAGYDVNGTISNLQSFLYIAQFLVNFPGLTNFLKHPFISKVAGPSIDDKTGPGFVQGMAVRAVRKRLKEGNVKNRQDMLYQMMEYEDSEGRKLSPRELEVEAFAPIAAGSDTTAVTIRMSVLHIVTNPRIYNTLMEELANAEKTTGLSTPITYKECQALPYLNAIGKEISRLCPAIGIPFPRVVPKGGVTISGHFLPEGAQVGLNPWCTARNKEVYGEDAEEFRPERWLENEEKRKVYDRYELGFGAGYTVCLGKNIATMEFQKALVELFRNFEVSVAEPGRPWEMYNSLVVLLFDFNIYLKPRKRT
jgi:cytochrome P450